MDTDRLERVCPGPETAEGIALRTLHIASGGDRDGHEARWTLAEKRDAAARLELRAMTDALGPAAATRRLRGKVRANRRRLRR